MYNYNTMDYNDLLKLITIIMIIDGKNKFAKATFVSSFSSN